MTKQEFYEKEEVRVRETLEITDPGSEEYPKLLARLDQIDNHKNLAVERATMNRRRNARGMKNWVSKLDPNKVFEAVCGSVAYLGGIKIVANLERSGGAFISRATSLFSKVKLRI